MESSLPDGVSGKGDPDASDAGAVISPCGQQELAFLARAVEDLSSLPLRADIYRRIGDLVLESVGSAAVAVQSYDAETTSLEVRALVGVQGILDGILSALGGHPVGMAFRVPEDALSRLTTGKLIALAGGLQDLAFGMIPRSICHAIELLVNLRDVYVIGIASGGELLGSIAIAPRGKSSAPNRLLLETLVGHASVVLQRRKAVASLRESEARYRLMAEHATDIVWTSDLHIRFTYVSASVRHVLGYTPDEMMSLPLRQLLPAPSLAVVRNALAEELAADRASQREAGYRREMELEATRKDGTPIWVEVHAEFSRDPEGNPVGILATTRDITDRKRHEQERRALEARAVRTLRVRFLLRLAASISRDLSASLEGATEGAVRALAHLDGPSPARAPLERSRDALAQGLALARRLRESGRDRQPALAEIGASVLFEGALSLLRTRVPAGIAVRGAAAEGLPSLLADADALTQSVTTLATLLVATPAAEGDALCLSIEATHLGGADLAQTYMDGDLRAGDAIRLKLSIPVHPRAEADANGMLDLVLASTGVAGLECAAALGVIGAHGGNLQMSREADTTLLLSLLLPTAPTAGGDPNIPAIDEDSEWVDHGPVVVADADIGARWLAKSALEQAGMSVVTAETLAEAVEVLRGDATVSVVLLDAALLPTGACAALRELRTVRDDIRVVLSSPFGEEPVRPVEGFAGFVQKPYLPKVLVGALRKVLRS